MRFYGLCMFRQTKIFTQSLVEKNRMNLQGSKRVHRKVAGSKLIM